MIAGAPGAALRRFLDRLRLLMAAVAAGTALARLATVAAVALALNTLVVERLHAFPWAAFALAAAGTLGVVSLAARLLVALPPPSRQAAARRVQAVERELRNDVESSLALEPMLEAPAAGISSPLVGALVGSTGERLAGAPAWRFVPWREARRAALLLAAAAVPVAALAATAGIPAVAARALVDPRAYWPLGQVRFVVEPGEARVVRGADLEVRVRIEGPRAPGVLVGFAGATGEGTAAMERRPDGVWSWRFTAVTGEFDYRAVAGNSASPWYRVQVVDAPAAGNFEMRYTYPAYSGLAPRTVSGGAEIVGLRGTSVDLGFSTSVEVAKAAVVLGANRIAVSPAGERRMRAALYLNGETSYRIELEDGGGITNGGGPEYPVRLLPDAPPVVEVTEPAGQIESDARGVIVVRYRAADDYGLSRLALVARSAAGERRWPLPLAARARSAGGEYEWEPGALEAQPGETVSVVVEAADNDTISGPKVAASAPFLVRIADPRVLREQLGESMDRLADELVQMLGDQLDVQARYEELQARVGDWERFPWQEATEAAARQQAVREAAERAEQRAAAIAEAMGRDPAAREESVLQAELIREGLAELRERELTPLGELAASLDPSGASPEETAQKTGFMAETAARAARKSEELALMADAMKRERGMADVERNARDMAGAEERLLDGLERLSPGDRAAAEQVLKELAAIEEALRELAHDLMKQNQELPEEFLNSDAIESLDLDEVLDALEQVRELLRQGDVAGARRAARELAKRLAGLRERLRQAEEEVDERQRKAVERLRGSTVPRLRKLAEDQRVLLERTEGLEGQAGPRLERALAEMARSRNTDRPPAEADVLTPEERGRADALAREQEGLRQSAQGLADEVAALRAALPFLPSGIGADLEEAGARMGEAGALLGRREPGRALPPERAALAALQRAGDQASRALDDLSQMQEMRQGASGRPMSHGMPTAPRPGGGSSDQSRSRRSGGRRGTDVRNFVIPGRQDHRVPKMFREEIMKSLEDGYPAPYEQRIRDYYQRITE